MNKKKVLVSFSKQNTADVAGIKIFRMLGRVVLLCVLVYDLKKKGPDLLSGLNSGFYDLKANFTTPYIKGIWGKSR